MNKDKIKVITNPVICQNLSTMRAKNSTCEDFRRSARKISRALLYEASKNLPLTDKVVETPITKCTVKDIATNINIIISPILRAGLVFTDEAIDLLPNACIRHIGMYRDEDTLKPIWYYNKLPKIINNPKNTYVYVTDPMLATGNSMLEVLRLYTEKGVPQENIRGICILSAPQGIELIQSEFPEIELITAAIDEKLNENGYIVPGLGDAGDRLFNTL